jgi:hypothetical protein
MLPNENCAASRSAVKSWVFAGSDRGRERAAVMYTLIQTAKLNDIDPQAWLADVLARINDHNLQSLDQLLPWNWKAALGKARCVSGGVPLLGYRSQRGPSPDAYEHRRPLQLADSTRPLVKGPMIALTDKALAFDDRGHRGSQKATRRVACCRSR